MGFFGVARTVVLFFFLGLCEPYDYTEQSVNGRILANPERGFYHTFATNASSITPFDPQTFKTYYKNEGITLLIMEFILDKFKGGQITSDFLDNKISGNLKSAAKIPGVKVILRFLYTDSDSKDAPVDVVKQHIKQLTPVFQANWKIILVVQAGFVGKYGEWCFTNNFGSKKTGSDSCNGTSATDDANRKTVVQSLLQAIPSQRMLQVRTVNIMQNIAGCPASPRSSQCARVGLHNDCFLSKDGGDADTYVINSQKSWLNSQALSTMVGGESCGSDYNADCSYGENQIQQQRFTYLNKEWNDKIVKSWSNNGCYNRIGNRLGYRFVLTKGTFPSSVSKGKVYAATAKVRNDGVAPLYYKRSAYAYLRKSGSTGDANAGPFFQQQIDATAWMPNDGDKTKEYTFLLTFTIPSTIATGTYDVLLSLPDANIPDDKFQRILFANDNGVQDMNNRFNVIQKQLSITT